MRGVKKQKAPRKAMQGFLAPRPGLEPGTYGLTESQASQKSKYINSLQAKMANV